MDELELEIKLSTSYIHTNKGVVLFISGSLQNFTHFPLICTNYWNLSMGERNLRSSSVGGFVTMFRLRFHGNVRERGSDAVATIWIVHLLRGWGYTNVKLITVCSLAKIKREYF